MTVPGTLNVVSLTMKEKTQIGKVTSPTIRLRELWSWLSVVP